MQYIILAYEAQQDIGDPSFDPGEHMSPYWTAWRAYIAKLQKARILQSDHVLFPEYTATTVRIREGKQYLHDGPYTNSGEHVARCIAIDVGDLDQALEWVRLCPAAAGGAVEIRPLVPGRFSEASNDVGTSLKRDGE